MIILDAHDRDTIGEEMYEAVITAERRRGAAISHIIIDEHGLRFSMPIEREEERFDRDRAESDRNILYALLDAGLIRSEQLGPLVNILKHHAGECSDDTLRGFAMGVDAVCRMLSSREESRV